MRDHRAILSVPADQRDDGRGGCGACENRSMPAIDPDSPRYARQRVLPGWGVDAQRRLADARVVVLGAGGLGSFVVPALVAAGVGTVVVVDDDDVDVTNLHRQLLHAPGDVGRLKVESAADAAFDLSPDTNLVPAAIRFKRSGVNRTSSWESAKPRACRMSAAICESPPACRCRS